MNEGEGEGDLHFHLLSFSTFLPFDICVIMVFDIFPFGFIQMNLPKKLILTVTLSQGFSARSLFSVTCSNNYLYLKGCGNF